MEPPGASSNDAPAHGAAPPAEQATSAEPAASSAGAPASAVAPPGSSAVAPPGSSAAAEASAEASAAEAAAVPGAPAAASTTASDVAGAKPKVKVPVNIADSAVAYILPGLHIVHTAEAHFDILVPKSKPQRPLASQVQQHGKWNPLSWFSKTLSPTAMYVAYLAKVFEAMQYAKSLREIDEDTKVEIWMPKKLGTKESKVPVLMLHGFGSDATLQWDAQVTQLSKKMDLLMPNLVFFGNSTTSSKERSMTWQGDCMIKLMDKLGIGTFDLLGFSYGSAVAYKVGLKYGHRIRRIVIADEGIMMNRQDMRDMQVAEGIDDGNGFWKLPSTPDEMRKLEQIAFKQPMPVPDIIYKDVLKTLFSSNIKEWNELIHEYTTDRPENPYDNKPLTHPLLFIWGEDDPMAPLRFAKMQVRHFGTNSRLLAIKGAKHMAHAEFPKEWNAAVCDFLLSKDGHAPKDGGVAAENVQA